MRKTLLATTALAAAGAFAAGPVLAADMLSVGLSGYMEQWVGGTDIEEDIRPNKPESLFGQRSDSEINFTGTLQSDMGLTFGVKVEMEADASGSGSGGIDESVATVKGGFGTFHIGGEDGVQPTMHYGVPDVGIGLNAGDVKGWLAPVSADWSTSLWSGGNDVARLIYYTPRINGVQLGVSYAPDMTRRVNTVDGDKAGEEKVTKGEKVVESSSVGDNNEDTETSIAVNFDQAVGDAHIKASVGYSVTTTDAGSKAVANRAGVMQTKGFGDTADFNIGGQVSMSGFTVAAAYSEVDAEEYKGTLNTTSGDVDFAEDRTKDVEVMALGVSYADGPMALSASWSEQQRGGGDNDTATALMFSASYLLAPGVEIKSSLFTAEDETARVTTGYGADERTGGDFSDDDVTANAEGTGFVIGLKIGF